MAAIAAIMGTAVSVAQQIAVVSENGSTDVYQTLTEAIEGASNGSVIYLPGGGFQIHDSVKITKRICIIGIGHKAKTENVDGNTMISGNLFFNVGSSGSSVMGCHISGNVNIGADGAVNNVLVKYCNLNGVSIKNKDCSGTTVNQNYIRSGSSCSNAEVTFTNNIAYYIINVEGGRILNNLFTYYNYGPGKLLYNCFGTIVNNIFITSVPTSSGFDSSNSTAYGNMGKRSFGEDFISITAAWTDVFVNYNGGAISPASDFHFKPDYQQYSDCGIYGGTDFSDGALPPVPFIVSKSIPEQTDASGKLNIKIRVKAGE